MLNKINPNSIAWRYLLIVGSVLVFGQLLFAGFVMYSNFTQQRDDLHQKAVTQANFLSSVSPNDVLANNFYPLETLMRQTIEDGDFIYSIVIHLDGRVLTNYLNAQDKYIIEALENAEQRNTIGIVDYLSTHPNIIEVTSPIISEGLLLGEVRLGYTAENLSRRLRSSIFTILAISVLIGGTLVLLTMQQFNRQISTPISNLNSTAQAFAQGNLDARSSVDGNNEINELQGTFNQMASQLQDNLHEMEKLSHVASRTKNMVVICNAFGKIDWVNDAFVQITGYALEEVSGRSPGHFLQGKDSDPEVIKYMRAKIREGVGFNCKIINYSKAGKAYWVSIEAQPVYDDQNQLINYIAIETDISEKVEAESKLKDYIHRVAMANNELEIQQTRLRALLEIATTAKDEFDSELALAVVQGATTLEMPIGLLSRLDADEFKVLEAYAPALELYPGLGCPIESSLCYQTVSEDAVTSFVNLEFAPEGLPAWLGDDSPRGYIGAPIKVNDRIFGTLSFLTDEDREPFTESETDFVNMLAQWIGATIDRQQSREELITYSRDLERSNKELVDFAHIASHDLQEPLRKIQAFGSRLESKYATVLDDRGVDYVQRMQNAASRMQILVQELLSYSLVTTQAKPFEPTDLQVILDEVLIDLEIRIELDNAQLDISPLSTIDADAIQMRQLFQNIIGNALKFTVPGRQPRITVEGYSFVDDQENEIYELIIADNGIGFDEKYIKKIFGIFQQVHKQNGYEGTGVGLAICKKIIERHSGTINVKSEPNVGTTFIIQLPMVQEKTEHTTGETV